MATHVITWSSWPTSECPSNMPPRWHRHESNVRRVCSDHSMARPVSSLRMQSNHAHTGGHTHGGGWQLRDATALTRKEHAGLWRQRDCSRVARSHTPQQLDGHVAGPVALVGVYSLYDDARGGIRGWPQAQAREFWAQRSPREIATRHIFLLCDYFTVRTHITAIIVTRGDGPGGVNLWRFLRVHVAPV